jgi:hypothetical protein
MVQDDPEKRIGDPQGRGSRKPGLGAQIVRVVALICVVGGVYFLAVGYFNYTNSLHTPTTAATIDHCDNETTCYGKWSAGGVSKTGRIYGDLHGDHPVGSKVDVHVWRGRAYLGRASQAPAILLMAGSFVAIAAGVVLWWFLRRKYTSR